mgnify:CR=1 FL=1
MSQYHILIVEDDETILYTLKETLLLSDYQISTAQTLSEAKTALSFEPDLILLDLNLPDGTGFSFCEQIGAKQQIPIIILTARDEDADIVRGLDLGADDYVTKPFTLAVLLSRIAAVIRRSKQHSKDMDFLRCQDLVLNKKNTSVTFQGKPVELTVGEYRLLEYLLINKNRTLTRDMLLTHLWDAEGKYVNDNTLTVMMKRLRSKLASDSGQFIKTIRGIGYKGEDYHEE